MPRATAHSKLCGSTVTVDLKMDGDTVTDFAHDVKACALGQASSSIMARNVVGAKADELRDAARDRAQDAEGERRAARSGKWADIAVLEPVRDYKARHASTMLTFDAVVDAINQIEAKRSCRRPSKRNGERCRVSKAARRAAMTMASINAAARPAPRRPRADQGLSLHALAAGRLSLPPPADLLGICRRGARPLRPVGRRLDDARAAAALPAMGHVRHRPRAHDAARTALGIRRGVTGAGGGRWRRESVTWKGALCQRAVFTSRSSRRVASGKPASAAR